MLFILEKKIKNIWLFINRELVELLYSCILELYVINKNVDKYILINIYCRMEKK